MVERDEMEKLARKREAFESLKGKREEDMEKERE